jgi:NAD(P)-dependent dehydrogenase (short-subunit alcohol dehydrogenase family)
VSGRLEGKVALVTGAAAGIGRATAELFAREGAKVAIADVSPVIEELARGLRDRGWAATALHLDVAKEEDWEAAVASVCERHGALDVLVNNAGISLNRPLEQIELHAWERIFAVNVSGVFLGMKHTLPAMRESGRPCSIVNRSSIEALSGSPGRPAYSATKGAIQALSRSAAVATGPLIRVNTVNPGWIHTEMVEDGMRRNGLDPEAELARIGAEHPAGRIGSPEDVAYLDLYLASDESRFVTGASFVIDGGWTAR